MNPGKRSDNCSHVNCLGCQRRGFPQHHPARITHQTNNSWSICLSLAPEFYLLVFIPFLSTNLVQHLFKLWCICLFFQCNFKYFNISQIISYYFLKMFISFDWNMRECGPWSNYNTSKRLGNSELLNDQTAKVWNEERK